MNKILKCAFGLLTLITLNIALYSNADTTPDFVLNPPAPVYTTQFSANTSRTFMPLFTTNSSYNYDNYTACIPDEYVGLSFSGGVGIYKCTVAQSSNSDDPRTNENCYELKNLSLYGSNNAANNLYLLNNKQLYCYNFDTTTRYIYISYGEKKSGGIAFPLLIFNRNTLKSYFNSGYVEETSIDSQYCISNNLCPGNVLMTQNQCESIYNLIPQSSINANYCRLNFDLIDPQECPINEGTGAIVRSNLMINNTPYAQNQNINMFIPDFLQWNIAFNDLNTTIEIEGYNADEEYIENVINQEKLTPTPEDFTYLIQGTANFIPYLFIGLLILFAVKIFGKVWK